MVSGLCCNLTVGRFCNMLHLQYSKCGRWIEGLRCKVRFDAAERGWVSHGKGFTKLWHGHLDSCCRFLQKGVLSLLVVLVAVSNLLSSPPIILARFMGNIHVVNHIRLPCSGTNELSRAKHHTTTVSCVLYSDQRNKTKEEMAHLPLRHQPQRFRKRDVEGFSINDDRRQCSRVKLTMVRESEDSACCKNQEKSSR